MKDYKDDDLLTSQEAAEVLAVAPRTLEKWREREQGPAYVKLGRAVRYRYGELRRWLASHTYTATHQYSRRTA
jgi:excisionase family DNA binding protein